MKGAITVTGGEEANADKIARDRNNKQVISKSCASFTDCINQINNKQVDNAKDLDAVMSMYNLI